MRTGVESVAAIGNERGSRIACPGVAATGGAPAGARAKRRTVSMKVLVAGATGAAYIEKPTASVCELGQEVGDV
ncbi:hypothetical protein GCM10007198_25160 [Microbacterium aerolatum]|uniref:Uncharacterized protein n=1 Tax=Microbacterium aerolatum TaxID=153731 RepID=A0A511AGZ4_9MICO|nr:hypothetical protein MAE01_26200 [Microbacterium aerolatum]GGB33603.1 hypothetical protein GCM10007198_25160 [Microbacterium aerolatum]